MNNVEIEAKIMIYEIDNKDVDICENKMILKNHYNSRDKITISVSDNKNKYSEYTIIAKDLINAINSLYKANK